MFDIALLYYNYYCILFVTQMLSKSGNTTDEDVTMQDVYTVRLWLLCTCIIIVHNIAVIDHALYNVHVYV